MSQNGNNDNSSCKGNCDCKTQSPESKAPPTASDRASAAVKVALEKPSDRRSFLKASAAVVSAGTIAGMALEGKASKGEKHSSAGGLTFEEFFQKHYRELTPDEKVEVYSRLEREAKEQYGVDVKIGDPPPIEGVQFGYFLNLMKCNGNRKCIEACAKENNQDESISYIKVVEMNRGSFNLEEGNVFYSGTVPKPGKFYLPVQCHQCDNPPCVKACPIEATWKEKDGIVVVDYNWCIGCRYCMVACPYEARSFNFKDPEIKEINPNQSYLSNRIRQRGVVEKCTFCLHRTRTGRYPACLEACPTGARKFGNLLDKDSEVYFIYTTKKLFILKEELNTLPRFFYYFDE